MNKRFITLIIVYALISIVITILIPTSARPNSFLSLSPYRLALVGIFSCVIFSLTLLLLYLKIIPSNSKKIEQFIASYPKKNLGIVLYFITSHLSIATGIGFIVLYINFSETYAPYLIRLSPLIFFLVATSLQTLLWDRSNYPDREKEVAAFFEKIKIFFLEQHKILIIVYVIVILALGSIYLYWGTTHAKIVNTNPQNSDQHSYLSIAKQAYETDFQYKGDRNRTPLYSYLLALFYKPDMGDIAFFEKGKVINVVLSLILLVIIFLITSRTFSKLQSGIFTLIIGFGLFIYKSGYVQAELLFYFLFFCSFVLMLDVLARPTPQKGLLLGFVVGLTYLSKASVLVSLVIFLFVFLGKQILEEIIFSKDKKYARSITIKMLSGLSVLLMFLLVVSPYITENKKIFGQYFYNVNSTFYMWYDNWAQAANGTKAHGDAIGWPDIPENELPSMQKYLAEHSTEEILERFRDGTKSQLKNIKKLYSKFNYLLVYTAALIIFFLSNFRKNIQLLLEKKYQVLLSLGIFASSLFLYSWFSPIADHYDERFTYSLYIPYMYCLFCAINEMLKKFPDNPSKIFSQNKMIFSFGLINLAIVGSLIYEIIYHIPPALTTGWFGK